MFLAYILLPCLSTWAHAGRCHQHTCCRGGHWSWRGWWWRASAVAAARWAFPPQTSPQGPSHNNLKASLWGYILGKQSTHHTSPRMSACRYYSLTAQSSGETIGQDLLQSDCKFSAYWGKDVPSHRGFQDTFAATHLVPQAGMMREIRGT